MKPSERLAILEIALPQVAEPVGSYMPAIRSGHHIYTSGQLPMQGGELVCVGKLREIRSDVRVLLSSGFTEQEMINRFRDAGLAGVVHKPAQMHVLLAKIADALKQVPVSPQV